MEAVHLPYSGINIYEPKRCRSLHSYWHICLSIFLSIYLSIYLSSGRSVYTCHTFDITSLLCAKQAVRSPQHFHVFTFRLNFGMHSLHLCIFVSLYLRILHMKRSKLHLVFIFEECALVHEYIAPTACTYVGWYIYAMWTRWQLVSIVQSAAWSVFVCRGGDFKCPWLAL